MPPSPVGGKPLVCASRVDTGPILFNIFINDLNYRAEGTFCKFTDVTKLGEKSDTVEGRAAIQKELFSLRKGRLRRICSVCINT